MKGQPEPIDRPPEDQLERLRHAIDEVDGDLVRLLDQRARLARQVGDLKAENQLEVYAPARESQVFKRVFGLSSGDFPRLGLEAVFREIISSARGLEAGLRVAYLGSEASLAHLAVRGVFGNSVLLQSKTSSAEVLQKLVLAEADYGVLPVEADEDGVVVHVLDRLWASTLKVCRCAELALAQHLISLAPALNQVTRVFASGLSLQQGSAWLGAHLHQAALVEVDSAAEGARRAAADSSAAAIGPAALAEDLSLRILASNVEGEGTRARFYVIGASGAARTGHDRCLFGFRLADQTGSLRDALNVFAEAGVDLRSIEARSPAGGAVVVFGEISGHPDDAAVADALAGLGRYSTDIRILGAYPEFPPGG